MSHAPKNSGKLRIADALAGRCPKCRQGSVSRGFLRINKECPVCRANFYPESGYYLGAMMLSYVAAAILCIPPIIALKISKPDLGPEVLLWSLLEFILLAPFLLHYSRIFWLHVETAMTGRLDNQDTDQERHTHSR